MKRSFSFSSILWLVQNQSLQILYPDPFQVFIDQAGTGTAAFPNFLHSFEFCWPQMSNYLPLSITFGPDFISSQWKDCLKLFPRYFPWSACLSGMGDTGECQSCVLWPSWAGDNPFWCLFLPTTPGNGQDIPSVSNRSLEKWCSVCYLELGTHLMLVMLDLHLFHRTIKTWNELIWEGP